MFGFGAPLTFLIIVIALIISGIKILKEYERAVVFRLGRMVGTRGPGITYIIPGVEKMVKMDLRTVTMDIPPQDVITRDNVSVKVNAVLYFRVLEPSRAVIEVENYLFATSQLAQVTLRSVCGQAELDELLAESDFVTLHVPLDDSTRGMIGDAQIAAMKGGAFLINTARGGIVDEQALKRALIDHKLAGAAFDVFQNEPPADTELVMLPNFVGTPHVGASTTEAVLAMGRAAIAGLDDDSRTINR